MHSLYIVLLSRMTKLVDDELEADEEFWGQDAFKEVSLTFSPFYEMLSSLIID